MLSPRSRIVVSLLLGVAACGPATPSADEPTEQTVKPAATPDTPDKCPMLLGCYERTPALAHCKEPTLRFRAHSTELDDDSKSLLKNLADEIAHHGGMRSLLIEGHAAPGEAQSLAESRATAIQVGLVDRGVEGSKLATHAEVVKGASNEVTFVVVDCSRKKHVVAAPETPSYWLLLY
jgi:outer membrane protein OmpA-like peptidoglycan-associated protein